MTSDREKSNQLIRRAFERGFLELDQPSPELEFRYRVWCEARTQPFICLKHGSECHLLELDLSRGPCQLGPDDLEELRAVTTWKFVELSQTRCLAEIPKTGANLAATRLFELVWKAIERV